MREYKQLLEILRQLAENVDAVKNAVEYHQHNKEGDVLSHSIVKDKYDHTYDEHLIDDVKSMIDDLEEEEEERLKEK